MTDRPTRRIVFVCSGNICRSPMAEAMAKAMLDERDIAAVVISAGTLGIHGRKAAEGARNAVAEEGLDLSSHRSQGISMPLLRMADHIVCMAPRHAAKILTEDRSLEPAIVRLWEYADDPDCAEGIPDPVGKDIVAFRTARDRIRGALESWVDELT